MRLNFRQGIVTHQPGGFLLLNAGNVDLLANNVSVTVTIADRASNYTHTEDATVAAEAADVAEEAAEEAADAAAVATEAAADAAEEVAEEAADEAEAAAEEATE